jgi:fucose permease
MMMSLNAFIADISEPDQRAFRMAMLSLFMSLARPLGPPLGAYLLRTGD